MVSKLQTVRQSRGMEIQELALVSSEIGHCGCSGHMLLVIKGIETGKFSCPLPRKTYEWLSLAKALKCSVEDIYEKNRTVEL